MISYITGKLAEKYPTHVIIETGGIGYHIHISLNTYSRIGNSENCRLYTYFRVSEDAQQLYGFYDDEERTMFIHLISVSGIGPNTARLMLSSLNPIEVQQAIINGDVRTIQSVKGIGQKTAERAIVELKDKLKKEGVLPDAGLVNHNKVKDEALSALLMLGFGRNVAEKALDQVLKSNASANVELLIKLALKDI